ncbi:MAG: hypothetical protein IKP00_06705 [Victivallales bacterium]|nr:hypothetical protein [Victivallales bacterium]
MISCNYTDGASQEGDNPLCFLRLAAPLRYAARRKGTGGIACPWVSLAPEALASPTAMFLSPLTRLFLRLAAPLRYAARRKG